MAEDLLVRSTTHVVVDAGLRDAFHQIERGGRTAQAFEVWRDDYLDQVAVAWVLACVFVRFMEDNHLIDECWLAGEGDAAAWPRIRTNFSSGNTRTTPTGSISSTSSRKSARFPPPRICSPRGRRRSGRWLPAAMRQ